MREGFIPVRVSLVVLTFVGGMVCDGTATPGASAVESIWIMTAAASLGGFVGAALDTRRRLGAKTVGVLIGAVFGSVMGVAASQFLKCIERALERALAAERYAQDAERYAREDREFALELARQQALSVPPPLPARPARDWFRLRPTQQGRRGTRERSAVQSSTALNDKPTPCDRPPTESAEQCPRYWSGNLLPSLSH
jgi:hypothetical protein